MRQGFDGQFPQGEAGFAVSPSNPESICDAVLKILGSYEETSKRCLRLSEKFRWEKVVEA
jgi:glycosyltransferase involved in cell wall biosynthesis